MDCLYRSPLPRLVASRRGFALLITITLVAFLVLILVSLAALTRVETQVATNSQQLNHARQNALMALNIALGQLQKYAGPDQRVTTTADLIADEDKAGVAAPSPLYTTTPRVDVKPGSRHWTAAWGNTEQTIGYDISPLQIPPTTGNRRGVTPGLLNWLISGNESAAFTTNGTLGGVTAGTDITYAPGDAVDLTNPDAPTVKGDPAVILVGPNSVGDTPDALKDYVVAPLKNIEVAASSIPGADVTSTTPIRTGRYAWWVGDEGVKARVNLQNGYQKTGQTTDQVNSFISAQRAGIEFMDRDALGTDNLSTDYIFTAAALPNVNTPRQLSLLGADTTAQNNLSAAAKSRFHDITTSSYGVLSDTYAGGLKKDLTADIADSSSDFTYRPSDSTPIFTPINASEGYLPTWGHLRTWARTHPGSSGEITPSPASDTNAGIGPVLQYSAIGFDLRVRADRTVTLAIFPVVALYNPYPVPIAAARYDVGFKLSANSRMTIQTHPPEADENAPLLMADWVRQGEIDWGVPEVRPGNADGTESNNIVFTVDSQMIPPGESHIYYLGDAASDTPYTPGQLLERAPAGENANPLNYVYLPSSLVLDPTVVITDPVATPEDPDPLPTSHMMRVLTTDSNNSPGTTSSRWGSGTAPFATVTLAAEGGADDPQAWYQRSSVMTATSGMNRRQVIRFNESLADNATSAPAAFTMANSYEHLRISNLDSWAGETQGPRTAFRYCPRNTNGGDYNEASRTGNVQISTIWLRHSNFRAHYGQLTLSESAAPRDINRRGNMLFGVVLSNDNVSSRKVVLYPRPNEFALSMAHTPDAGGNPSRYSTYFDIMERPESLQSLGQLQHAPLSRYSFQTTYPFANSMADLRIPRTTHFRPNNVSRPDNGTLDPSYDLSWHLNRSIWDKYFLSTASTSLVQTDIDARNPLPNARLTYAGTPDINSVRFSATQKGAYDQAAANLLSAGAFNINSTSEQAWRAVLSGTYGVPQNSDYATPGDRVDRVIPFARISHSLSRPAGSGSGLYGPVIDSMVLDTTTTGPHNQATKWAQTLAHGNRGLLLTDPSGVATTNDTAENLVNELARTMVAQVRARGPFLSLADFVNRSMATTAHELGIKGAVQTAIDTMASSQANPFARWNSVNGYAVSETGYRQSDHPGGAQLVYPDWDLEHYLGGPVGLLTSNPERTAYRFAYANTPKYLTQADVLSTIGPSLSARSDTFTIRTYGEKRNPTTDEIEGRAWCEAIVQRVPDFVNNTSNPAHTALDDVSNENRTFGRKLVIVSFRWLAPSDI